MAGVPNRDDSVIALGGSVTGDLAGLLDLVHARIIIYQIQRHY